MSDSIQIYWLEVDGRKYGPYKSNEDANFRRLKNLKGVVMTSEMVDRSKLKRIKRQKRENRQMSLLQAMPEWRPTPKGGY